MIILPGYHHFGGQQVETAALHNVLAYLGVTDAYTGQPFSETLLFGIGGGIGTGYFVYASGDYTSLFIATRITTKETAQESFLHTICARLGFKVQTQTASSPALAEKKLRQALKEGHPVIAWMRGICLSLERQTATILWWYMDWTKGRIWCMWPIAPRLPWSFRGRFYRPPGREKAIQSSAPWLWKRLFAHWMLLR